MLNLAEYAIDERLEQRPWAEVERWLLNVNNEIETIRTSVMARIPDAREDPLWDLTAQVLPGNPDYRLRLAAIWRGPSSRPGGYYVEKSCAVTQVANRVVPNAGSAPGTAATSQTFGQVTCEPTNDKIWFQKTVASLTQT